jgi:glycerophosphoryl diester phosphodiesterase
MAVTHRALKGNRPLVFAHRGGAKLAPENTMEAFDRGLAAGADGLELDVRLSRDGEVVVMHDPTLDRTTPGRGLVSAFTVGELSRWRVPRLNDVLARYRDHALIIELKEPSELLARKVVDLVRQHEATDRVALGSFHAVAMRAVRELEPRIPTGAARLEIRLALYASYLGIAPVWASYQTLQVPEKSRGRRVVSRHFIRAAHRAGLAVQVWTVDEERDIRRLIGWGVDAIISDRPDVAVTIVQEGCR